MVSAARKRLDVRRVLRRVAERVAELLHRAVETAIEVHERVGRPQLLAQLFARNQLIAPRHEQTEDLERLLGKPDLPAVV